MNRFKRLIALLLCIATMLSLMGNGVPTALGEAAAVEAVEVTPAPEVVTAVEEAAGASCDYCTVTVAEDGTVTHEEDCVAEYVYDGTADVGKYAVLNPDAADYVIGVSDGTDFYDYMVFYYDEFDADLVMKITDWYWDAELTGLWYQVEAYEGAFPASCDDFTWPETAWILQGYTNESSVSTLNFVTVEEPEDSCDICGTVGCTKEHVRCDVCGNYDCVLSHVYCYICGTMDCTTEHGYCTTCGKYDCGVEHEDIYTPATAPVIPDSVTLPEGEVHVVADKDGNAVVGSFELNVGKKSSLSAWSKFDSDETVTDVSYKWQVRYDAFNDLWTDIRGQQGKGILMSPAMFLPLMEDGITPAIRSVVTANGETLTGDPIEITLDTTTAASSYTAPMALDLADEETDTELTKNYVVVRYEYSDGRNAASTDFAEIIPGSAYSHTYTLPVIPGYKASLNTHSYGDRVTLTDTALVMNFAENELTEDYAIFTVTYSPDYVNYTVIHYWQNVDNDSYTEHERQTVGNVYKTGEQITNAHNTYAGFYNLLYETPVAAADGSTVIEVYYDRYYYLMTFDLDDMGYGVEPVYARYGDTVEIGTPTRAGYTFLGWKLDGTGETIASADMPTTMPAENRKYVAQWQANDTAKVSVVIWGENPDDEEYSYLGTEEIYAKPGSQITWTANALVCGMEEHSHATSGCTRVCTIPVHEHMVENGCYILDCTKTSHSHVDCTLECSHVHDLNCYYINNSDWYQLEEINKPDYTLTHQGNGIYSYTRGGSTRYALNIGDSWYQNGRGSRYQIYFNCSHSTHDDTCYTCGETAGVHTHSVEAGCYDLVCSEQEHVHTETCEHSCGEVGHTHSDSCYASTDLAPSNLWTYVKSDTVTVEADGSTVLNVYYDRTTRTLTFHYNYGNGNYRTTSTITDKWGADIGERFLEINSAANGNLWSTETDGDSPWTSYLQIMPQNDEDYYCRNTSTNEQIAEYYTEKLDGTYVLEYAVTAYYGSNLTISKEDFYEMEGYTYSHGTDGDGDSMPSPGSYGDFDGAKFYYTRNSYSLAFNNGYTITNTVSVKYEDTLSAYKGYSPPLPDAYEAGSRTFAGWYLNPECTGERVNLDTFKMPAKNLILYAKWQPVEYKVNYYLTKESYDRGETIPEEMARLVDEAVAAGKITEEPEDTYTPVFSEDTVQHGSYITDLDDPGVNAGYSGIHPREGYKPIGWFYIDENGEEKAFDYENMPVTHDLDLYVKWSSDTLCAYNIYFVLDEDGDGVHDDGETTEVAAPISGSGIAGRTYTFAAKGGEALNEAYQDGYFPSVGSHSLVIDIQDVNGTGNNAYYFLYQQKEAMPYTVKYINDATGTNEFTDADGNTFTVPDKVVNDNKNVVVTENFQYIAGYMPDAYQKTLVVTTVENKNVIEFHYTKDDEHALYVVNYYIQVLDENLNHASWYKYTDLQNTGDIDTVYSADAITIDGFTLSASYTDGYNVTQKINGENNAALPAGTNVSALTDGKLSGTLVAAGMELNFYYTRNLYPYEFRYVLKGTATELANAEYGKAGYDTTVSGAAKEIEMDLDGDGNYEDYRLYDPTETTKDIHISKDGNPLDANADVVKGQANVNIATFEYIRCVEDMTITKKVVDNSDVSDPDPNQEFTFSLLIHTGDGYHQSSYNYTKTGGESGTLSPVLTAPNTLQFSLMHGQTITIEGLPTAEYTLTELNVPVGYYASYNVTQENGRYKHTEDKPVKAEVTNTYDPATLTISKTVETASEEYEAPDVEFEFKITFSDDKAYAYTGDAEGTLQSGETLKLEAGQSVRFVNLPVGVTYTVTEENVPTYFASSATGASDEIEFGVDYTAAFVNTYTLPKRAYTVQYLDAVTMNSLADEKIGEEHYVGTSVTENAIVIDGYTADPSSKTHVIVDGENVIEFLYTRDKGNLTIKKTVVNLDANNPAPNIPFQFTVSGLPNGAYTVQGAKGGTETQNVTNGTMTLSVRPEEPKTILNVPTGTYTITEAPASGFAVKYDEADEYGAETTAEVVKNDETTVRCINEYPIYVGSLKIEKTVENEYERAPDENFTFHVNLTPDSDAISMAKNFTVTVYEGDTVISTADPVTIPAGTSQYGFNITIKDGQYAMITGIPVGGYSVTETAASVSNLAVDYTTTHTSSVNRIEAAELSEEFFVNLYKRHLGNLNINKCIDFEYENEVWEGDTFTFEIASSDLKDGSYTYTVDNGEEQTAVAKDGKMTVTLEIPVETVIEPDKPFVIAVKDVFMGSYTVTEVIPDDAHHAYTTEPATMQASAEISPVDEPATVSFTNTIKRSTGNLSLSKQVVVEEDFTAPDGMKDEAFEFHIDLTDGTLVGTSYVCRITDKEGKETDYTPTILQDAEGNNTDIIVIMLKHGDTALLTNLPIGKYVLTEKAKEGYASNFNDIPGSLDTAKDITLPKAITADQLEAVVCYNRYPFFEGELIVQKQVATAGPLQADVPAAGHEFQYTLTLFGEQALPGTEYEYMKGGETGKLMLSDSETLTFSLKDGEQIHFKGLPTGDYSVTESGDVLKHYNVASKLADGSEESKETFEDTIAANDTDTVVFTNTYKQHLSTLTITKNVAAANEMRSFVFTVKGTGSSMDCGHDADVQAIDMRVVVTVPAGETSGSVTLSSLPLGTYTVTENQSWSWRYDSKTVEVVVDADGGAAVITNENPFTKWLSGEHAKKNVFNGQN